MNQGTNWFQDPETWPHTPPLGVFRTLVGEDPNVWWTVGCGHHQNLFENACDLLDIAEGAYSDALEVIDDLTRQLVAAKDLLTVINTVLDVSATVKHAEMFRKVKGDGA